MNPNLLRKLLRALRMTQNLEPGAEGQTIAAMNRANALLLAEGLEWTDLLGGDPDSPQFPTQPIWYSATLSDTEMQELFDAGYQKGLTEGSIAERQRHAQAQVDFLDLVVRSTQPNWVSTQPARAPAPPPPPFDYISILNRCSALSATHVKLIFTGWEIAFIEGFRDRLQHASTHCSSKQEMIWKRIDAKLKKEGI